MIRLVSRFLAAVVLAGAALALVMPAVMVADPAAAPKTRKLAIYDELANAEADVAAAVAQSKADNKPVLVVFGANWCPDCRAFDEDMTSADLGSLFAENYIVVKVDVGRFKKNMELGKKYGLTVKKGIPSIAILSGEDKPLLLVPGPKMETLREAGRPALVKYFDAALSPEKRAVLEKEQE